MTDESELNELYELDLMDRAEGAGDLDRRRFMILSVLSAAAATLGAGAALPAQAAGLAQAPQSPPLSLGNGESPAMQFQAYPGGTGALMERVVKERGAAAFTRTPFVTEKWSGAVPSTADDIAFLPAHKQAALIKARKLTATRLTDIYLERLERLNPTLNCAVTILKDQARAEAARADQEIAAGRYRGPLHGLPYGLKDLFATKGIVTTWGAKDFENRVIDDDAEVAVRLRDAGAILVAKLATGLFAQNDQWFRGRTNNPWNLNQGSSGSSAGPGSATAAGCVSFSIGTETQGSIVSPSIRNGISALRPTFGRVSRHGGMTLAWSMDRVGPMCRTVEDCAMVFSAIHGVDEKDPSTITMPFMFNRKIALGDLRVGVDPNAPKEFVEKLKELGLKPREVGPRPTIPGTGSGLGVEGAAAFDEYVQRKAKEIGLDLATYVPPTPNAGAGGAGGGGGGTPPANPMAPADWNPRFVNGRTVKALDFMQGQRRRYALVKAWGEYFKDLDMFIAAPAVDVGPTAQTGHPCVVVPYKFDNMPVGGPGGGAGGAAGNPQPNVGPKQPICATIVGNLFNDDMILAVAHRFQMATDVHLRRPTL